MPEGAREAVVVPGTVREALPSALFRVEIEGQRRGSVTAHVAGESGLLRLRPGDTVLVALLPYDAGRGRIVGRR